MSDAAEVRGKPAVFRRIANISTSGDGPADRVLILAERLEHEAAIASGNRAQALLSQ